MDLIARLYGAEKALKDLHRADRRAQRQIKPRPILDERRAWPEQSPPEVPLTLTEEALTDRHNQWPKLIGYLDDGRLEMDDNACARHPSLRHRRRNWRFANTPAGASGSANLYSLIGTTKANRPEPYRCLR